MPEENHVMPVNFEDYESIKNLIKHTFSDRYFNKYAEKLVEIRINGKGSHWLQQDEEGKLYPYTKEKRDYYTSSTATFYTKEAMIARPWTLKAPKIQGQQTHTTEENLHNDHTVLGVRFNPLYYSSINLGDILKVVPFLRVQLDDRLYLENDSMTYSIMPQVLEKLKGLTGCELENAINAFSLEIYDNIISKKTHVIEKDHKLVYRYNIKELTAVL